MSIVETLLIYVGIPVVVYAVVAVLVFAPGGTKTSRYRPGKGWSHEPVWYLPRPSVEGRHAAPALTSGAPALTAGTPAPTGRTAKGGASGTW